MDGMGGRLIPISSCQSAFYCGFDPLLLVRLVLRVRSPLANSHSTAGSIPSCQPKCAVVLLRIYTRLGNVASLVACSLGSLLCRSLERSTPISGVCTWMRRETSYASVERHRVRCLLSGVHGRSGEPSMPISRVQGWSGKPSMPVRLLR